MRFETIMTGLILVFCFLIKITSVDAPENEEPCKNKLICQESHNASAGENVTLDCHTESQCNVMDKSVTWEFGSEIVLLYRNKDVDPGAQADRFKGRAENNTTWNPAEGKLAVKIKSVKPTDAGEYTCSTGVEKDKVSCTTKLIFKQKPTEETNQGNRTSDSESKGLGLSAIIGIGIGAVVLLLIGGFAIYKYCKCQQTNTTDAAPNGGYGQVPMEDGNGENLRDSDTVAPEPNNDHGPSVTRTIQPATNPENPSAISLKTISLSGQ